MDLLNSIGNPRDYGPLVQIAAESKEGGIAGRERGLRSREQGIGNVNRRSLNSLCSLGMTVPIQDHLHRDQWSFDDSDYRRSEEADQSG